MTEKVFGLLLTALAVQMAFKGGRHKCDSSGYGPLTTRVWHVEPGSLVSPILGDDADPFAGGC